MVIMFACEIQHTSRAGCSAHERCRQTLRGHYLYHGLPLSLIINQNTCAAFPLRIISGI